MMHMLKSLVNYNLLVMLTAQCSLSLIICYLNGGSRSSFSFWDHSLQLVYRLLTISSFERQGIEKFNVVLPSLH
jgi:hypothetical protein